MPPENDTPHPAPSTGRIGPAEAALIRDRLAARPRDRLLFDLVTRTGLPMTALLGLKVGPLRAAPPGREVSLPGGRGKRLSLTMDQVIAQSLAHHLGTSDLADDDFVFKSRKGGRALGLAAVSRLVKGWLGAIGRDGAGGIIALRELAQAPPQGGSVSGETAGPESPGLTALDRIEVRTTQAEVYRRLEQAIVSGRLAPGLKLVAEEVAQQLGVSRAPVRDALGKLAARRFVTTIPNRGSFVNELSSKNLRDIQEIRLVNESMAARRSARAANPATAARLERLHRRYLAAWEKNDVDLVLRINRQFHLTLYGDADMPILLEVISDLWDRISPYLHILMRQEEIIDPRADIGFHRGMLDGMRRADPELVCRNLALDLNDASRMIEGLLDIKRHPARGD